MKQFWRIARIASVVVIAFALVDTLTEPTRTGPYLGASDAFATLRQYMAQFQLLFAVGFLMVSGLLIAGGWRPLGGVLFGLGVFFAVRAGLTAH